MTITQLIFNLSKKLELHGDLTVTFADYYDDRDIQEIAVLYDAAGNEYLSLEP